MSLLLIGAVVEKNSSRINPIPTLKMIRALTVTESPIDKVAAWQGMHRILFDGRIIAEAPKGLPLK